MNSRRLARTGGSLALILLSTSTANDCESMNAERQAQSQSDSQVVVRADSDVCWRLTVDGRTHAECGDATIYAYRSDREADVVRVDGDSDVTVTLVVDGRTIDRETVRTSGRHVRVYEVRRDTTTTSTRTSTRTSTSTSTSTSSDTSKDKHDGDRWRHDDSDDDN